MTLYQCLNNPLDDKDTFEKIIESYVDYSSFYDGLTKANSKDKIKGKYNVDDCNRFYVYLFNDWGKTLNALNDKHLITEDYQLQADVLTDYLKKLNPKTQKEVLKILDYEEVEEGPLKSAIKTFRFDQIGEYSGWEHIHSNYVRFGLSKKQEIKHRLYINCDSIITHRMMLRFIEKCNERKKAYYFKFDVVGARDDTVVICGDMEHIKIYIDILREVMEEEQLQNYVHKPPICTSPIDGWIGYGSEPNNKNGKKSFNEVREVHLEQCIKDESTSWMMRNLNTTFQLNGKTITYKEYIIRSMVREAKKHFLDHTRDTEYYSKYIGYTKSDLLKINLERLLRQYIEQNIDRLLSYYQNNDRKIKVEIPFKNGSLKIDYNILEEVRKKQISFMSKHSTKFKKDLLDRIKRTSKDYGIDSDNYACDIYVLNELGKENKEKKVTNVKVEPIIKETQTTNKIKTKKGYMYQPMTKEEIEASRKKLGF